MITAEHRLVESAQLARFFSKLLAEALLHRGAQIEFRNVGAELICRLLRDASEVRRSAMPGAWLDSLRRWLAERALVGPEHLHLPPLSEGCYIGVTIEGGAVIMRLTDGATGSGGGLILSDLRSLPPSFIAAPEVLSPRMADERARLIDSPDGTVIVVAPHQSDCDRTLQSLLASSRRHYVGALERQDVQSLVKKRHQEFPLLTSCRGNDVIDALRLLHDIHLSPSAIGLRGIVAEVFVRGLCSDCAREDTVENELLARLPAGLHGMVRREWHPVGCEKCQGTGYGESLCITQCLPCVGPLAASLTGEPPDAALASRLASEGFVPLLVNGLEKVARGATTLKEVVERVGSLSDLYHSWYQSSGIPSPEGGTATHEKSAPAKGLGRPIRVLVVEDDADQRAILAMVFRSAGYEVTLTADGVAGVEELNRNKPDLIVTDLMMPRMDGAELVVAVRKDPRLQSIPILVLTVVSDHEKEYHLLDLGADDYCEKTIQRKLLLKRVERLLTRTPGNAR